MSWFSQQWSKLTSGEDDVREPIQQIEVVWNRERLLVSLPRSTTPSTLQTLKQVIAQQSSIPYEQIKLIYQGLVLKDDRASLASYGLRNGSRLMLVGTQGGAHGDMPGAKSSMYEGGAKKMSKGEELARMKREKEEDVSEAGMLHRIDEAVAGVRKDLLPEVVEYEKTGRGRMEARAAAVPQSNNAGAEAALAAQTEAQQRSKAAVDALALRQRKLSELLLRALLVLDGINVNTDETRRRRKDAVKEVQSYLDRVDEAWQAIKAER